MIKEFKEFIARGNVLDLAVGLVMGSAFTAIVNSLVEFIITPIIVALTGEAKIEDLSMDIGKASLQYGEFIQAVINFFLVALVLFFIIKFVNTLSRRIKPEPEETPVEAPTVEELLEDIRDLLAKKDTD
ncbi:large conductance mechanosensitive channel protein MscL [Marinilactibacillus sp. Marseille-P9653]|uniref:large conductance mechanosensitive channel protein MscL n=1 Tax=Marinilactibacillus sp. Marseille-P9653 TaxID=2866583 RepID=UPI001CE416ED|nr:large conductance mechanosensitive channel protein MscL [Marinilactibacillus sp. Marseille-P9653]